MAKSNQTANEAQLKARRTSLGKKSNDELITIILRKDKSERKMNSKIQELNALLIKADTLNTEQAKRIFNFDKDMEAIKDRLSAKEDIIAKSIIEENSLRIDCESWFKRCVVAERRSLIYERLVFGLSITILIILFFSLL